MIIKSLYESLQRAINEARVQRTIDNKLWLSVASTISRNRSTEAEFIKPRNETKELLMQRYVAALIILRKTCPTTEQEMEDIKTYKLVGKKILDLGGTFKEIYDLYLKNGGTPIANSPQDAVTNAEQELQQSPDEQVQEAPVPNDNINAEDEEAVEEMIEDLPEGVLSYNSLYRHVVNTYTDILEILNNIASILETKNFEINRTFFKIKKGKEYIYFNKLHTDDEMKIYSRGARVILMEYSVFKLTTFKQYQMKPYHLFFNETRFEDQQLNDMYTKGYDVDIDGFIMTKQDFLNLVQTALAKLLFVVQNDHITNPLKEIKIDKDTNKYRKPIGVMQPVPTEASFTPEVRDKLADKIQQNYSTFEELEDFGEKLLMYGNGNEPSESESGVIKQKAKFTWNKPLYTIKYRGRNVYLNSLLLSGWRDNFNCLYYEFTCVAINNGEPIKTRVSGNQFYYDWRANIDIPWRGNDKYQALLTFITYICYFTNNINV